jgi:hypothetical protein
LKYLHAFLMGTEPPSKNLNTYPHGPRKPRELPSNENGAGFLGSLGNYPQVFPKIKATEPDPRDLGNTYPQDTREPRKPTSDEGEPGSRDLGNTYPQDTREPRKQYPPIVVVRQIVASLPIPLRERWGRRANELADQGVPHPLDERRAYAEIVTEPTETRPAVPREPTKAESPPRPPSPPPERVRTPRSGYGRGDPLRQGCRKELRGESPPPCGRFILT